MMLLPGTLLPGILTLLCAWAFTFGVQAEVHVSTATSWRLHRGTSEASTPGEAWRDIGFDDSGWEAVQTPIGYSDSSIEPPFFPTDNSPGTRLTGMKDSYSCIFLRAPFLIQSITNLAELSLDAAADDGFAAWINGVEIARVHLPDGPLSISTLAFDGLSEPTPIQHFGIRKPRELLREGTNVLAVQVFNRALDSSDLGFLALLDSTPALPPVGDTHFSRDRGFYLDPFELEIQCATVGAQIYYTLNGSSPSRTNGTLYAGPFRITETSVVRARAEKDGYQASNVDTQSYLFLKEVGTQANDGKPPAGWPAKWGQNSVDYGMDRRIVTSVTTDDFVSALRSIPSLSLVIDPADMFGAERGIYANPGESGRAWERPCSLEWLEESGREGFHAAAGLRIRGGFSRDPANPKHSFHIAFRGEYGDQSVKYPIFGADGPATIDRLDLRTPQDNSWAFQGDANGLLLNDPFVRETLVDLGQSSERGGFIHLYINGLYWGIYNTCERVEAHYGSSYFGGDAEDYDVLRAEATAGFVMRVVDGNDESWRQLWRAATNGFGTAERYYAVQGRLPNGGRNPGGTNLLEVEALVDFMLTIIWSGDWDGPLYGNLDDAQLNNYFAFRSRRNTHGFRFVIHDAELSLQNVDEDRSGKSKSGDPARCVDGHCDGPERLNPHYLWTRLQESPDFRLLVQDRIQRHFFNGGALTPELCTARIQRLAKLIDPPLVAESARWGDAKRANDPIIRDDWRAVLNDKLRDYFPRRSGIVLDQLTQGKLWPPELAAPNWHPRTNRVSSGTLVTLSNPNSGGELYYSRNGDDPRVPDGTLAVSAIRYSTNILAGESQTIRVRIRNGALWSPEIVIASTKAVDASALQITEIMYHPRPDPNEGTDSLEYLELLNAGAIAINLDGYSLADGVQYLFARGATIEPGERLVLAQDPKSLEKAYPGLIALGPYDGKLANSGEVLTLRDPNGQIQLRVAYDDRFPETDGPGRALVLKNGIRTNAVDADSWSPSADIGGSPGRGEESSSFRLQVEQLGRDLILSWTANLTPGLLESAPSLGNVEAWTPEETAPIQTGQRMMLKISPGNEHRFFRLRSPKP